MLNHFILKDWLEIFYSFCVRKTKILWMLRHSYVRYCPKLVCAKLLGEFCRANKGWNEKFISTFGTYFSAKSRYRLNWYWDLSYTDNFHIKRSRNVTKLVTENLCYELLWKRIIVRSFGLDLIVIFLPTISFFITQVEKKLRKCWVQMSVKT